MKTPNFILLQNEGYLLQGCLKGGLRAVLTAPSGEPGKFYAAFFNYATGLERLLKILLMLDHWHQNRTFPDNERLRRYGGKSGHNVESLYHSVRGLFAKHGVDWRDRWNHDQIQHDILSFLADFANGSRYFNLDQLVGSSYQHKGDPIHRWQKIFYNSYSKDAPKAEQVASRPDVHDEQMSTRELVSHHCVMMAARPHVAWRLTQLIVPLLELTIAIRQGIQKQDLALGGDMADASVPFMEEFLDFVCEDKTVLEDPEVFNE